MLAGLIIRSILNVEDIDPNLNSDSTFDVISTLSPYGLKPIL